MRSTCPITGEVAEVIETMDRVTVKHSTLGRYVIDVEAIALLTNDAKTRRNLSRWILESHSSNTPIPGLTEEYIHFIERISNLEATITEWNRLRPGMEHNDDEELWKKLNLEWNYNSNHIEGNTLTYHETELLLIYGRTAGSHPLRDYEEMKAHSLAIEHVRSLAHREHALAATDIRDINKIILKEPFWKNAETLDGHPTRKRIVPGEYKTQPNHVRTPTGELHRFAEPGDTPALMEEWVNHFRSKFQKIPYPLPLYLAESHWKFLRIHPFDDGNGRTARLLSNYALLRHDLLPIVIRSRERDRYIAGLQNADTGHILPLAEFMLDNILWSLTLGIRAAKGESIWESEDIDKEVAVFVRDKQGRAPTHSDIEAIDNVLLTHVRPTLEKLGNSLDSLSRLFHTYNTGSFLDIGGSRLSMTHLFEPRNWERVKQERIEKPGFYLSDDKPVEIGREFRFHNYTGKGSQNFNITLSITWIFGAKGFSLKADIDRISILDTGRSRTLYSELHVREMRVDHTVKELCSATMTEIERRAQKYQEE